MSTVEIPEWLFTTDLLTTYDSGDCRINYCGATDPCLNCPHPLGQARLEVTV